MHPSTEFLRRNYVYLSRFCGHTLNFGPFWHSSLDVSRETRSTAICSRQTGFEAGIAILHAFAPTRLLLWERTESCYDGI